MIKKALLLIFGVLLLSACKKVPELENVDTTLWKKDAGGCTEVRLDLVPLILQQKEKLKGLSENQIKAILGKPDQHELYERSQKFFIYHLEKGNECAEYSGNYFKSFYIRFNSLDQAVAFTIQEIK